MSATARAPDAGGTSARAPAQLKKYAYLGDPLAGEPPEELAEIIDRHRGSADALITVLEEIQRTFGYLGDRQLRFVARDLGFPLARIYGVVTFYNWFLLDPPGKHQVKICRGTACHVNGSKQILDTLAEHLGIGVDQTTPDGRITLQTVACVGACSLAAVVVIGTDTHGRVGPGEVLDIVAVLPGDEDPPA